VKDLLLKKLYLKKVNKLKNSRIKTSTSYTVKLVSLITPLSVKNSSLYALNLSDSTTFKKNKLVLKQSYILLIWFNRVRKGSSELQDLVPTFSFLPKKITKLTKIKAPMAHKTFSQEQFKFSYYQLVISFKSKSSGQFYVNNLRVLDMNSLYYLLLSLKYVNIPLGTNMLSTKSFAFEVTFFPKKFLIYKNF